MPRKQASRSQTSVKRSSTKSKGSRAINKSPAKAAKKPTPTSKSRSRTPANAKKSASNSKSVTPTKPVAKSNSNSNKAQRKFYTVKEDYAIFKAWKNGVQKSSSTVSDIAKRLGKELDRSDESIRDRIKRYLSKLNQSDGVKLAEAAKKTPNHHIHFVNDKQGHPFKCIGSIGADDPAPKMFTVNSSAVKNKKASPSPKKATEKASRSKSPVPANKSPADKSPVPTATKSKRGSEKKNASVLKKRSPEKSESRSPVKKPTKQVKSASPKPSTPVVLAKDSKKIDVNEGELRTKQNRFKEQLKGKSAGDVKKNAEVLAEVVKGFSSSYGVDISDMMTMLSKQKGEVNLSNLRERLDDM